ncbi:MAG TPA: PilN domain-containing protein, partial [Afifellaceae bacterium]|nr:PilN domain-containing protein [Afifellaceae bacterium]
LCGVDMDVTAAVFVDSVRRFAAWWSMELRSLVPARALQWFDDSGRAAQLILGHDSTVAFRDSRRGGAAETTYRTLDEAVGTAQPLLRHSPLQVVLAVEDYFAREVSIPRGARSRLRDVLGIELEQSTPFRPDDIYWGYRLQPGTRGRWIAAKQFIAKRSRVHAILEPLRRAGAMVQAIGVQDTDGNFVSLHALPERPVARAVRLLLRSTLLVLVAASVILAGATIALLFQRQNVAMSELQAEIESMREQAVAVRTRLEEVRAASLVTDAMLQRKFETAPLVTVLEEASRILPETAWVTELRFEGHAANLSGEAQSAPELINLLEASPVFSQVAFVAPVTRAVGSATESFAIRVAIEGAGAPGAGAWQAKP